MNPAGSPQKRPRSYQISGYYKRKKAVIRRGIGGMDARTVEGKRALQWRSDILKALGGHKKLSPQRSMLLDMLTLRAYRWLLITAWMTAGKKAERVLDKRRKRTWPIMAELETLESGIYRDLDRLGWDARTRGLHEMFGG